MAFVTFIEDESTESSRVLEKRNGQWKILRMDAIASKAFHNFHQLYALQRMAGEWEIDMASHKKEGGGTWDLKSSKASVERTSTGIILKGIDRFIDKNGEARSEENFVVYSVDMETSKVGVYSTSFYPNSNWSEAHTAVGEFDENGVLHCKGHQIGDEEKNVVSHWTVQLDGNQIKWAITVKDKTGKQLYKSSANFSRTDMPIASTKP